jgi:hypothetical protein
MKNERDDLPSRITNWLNRQGYPLELRIGRELAKLGWDVSHGRYFTDLRSGKPRELDVRAAKRLESRASPFIHLSLAIQCKHSAGRPWVGFESRTPSAERRFPGAFAIGELSSAALFFVGVGSDHKVYPDLLRSEATRSHGITDVTFEKKRTANRRNRAFAAVRSAEAAAAALAREVDRADSAHDVAGVTFEVPVVVFEGELFRFEITADGGEVLQPADWLRVAVPSTTTRSSHAWVHVIQPSALSRLVESADRDLALIDAELRPKWSELSPQIRHFYQT